MRFNGSLFVLKKNPPQKNLSLGVVGCGQFARYAYLPSFNRKDFPFSISCLYSRTKESANKIRSRLKYKVVSTDQHDIILNSGINCVLIILPHYLHYEYAIEALNKGLNVFCEKPVTNTLSEAYELKSVVEKKKAVFMVGYNYRYFEKIRQVKKYICDGLIGDVLKVCASFEQNAENIIRKSNWLNDLGKSGGGVIANIGCHMVNVLQYFFGRIDTVLANVENRKLPENFGEDTAICKLYFKNGIFANINLCVVSETYSFYRYMLFEGRRGELLVDDGIKYRKSKSNQWELLFSKKETTEDSVFKELCHFYNCAKMRNRPDTDINDAIETLKVIKAAYISSNKNSPVKINDIEWRTYEEKNLQNS